MEARELFAEIEAFVKRTRDEAITKPGINGEGHTYLLGAESKYRDPVARCCVYFSRNYYSVQIDRGFRFEAQISNGVVSVNNTNALAFMEHKEEILALWGKAIGRTSLSLYEQELEQLIVRRDSKHKELRAIDREIREHKKKVQQATNGGN